MVNDFKIFPMMTAEFCFIVGLTTTEKWKLNSGCVSYKCKLKSGKIWDD